MSYLPIHVIDLKRSDRSRIQEVLRSMDLDATDEQLESLRQHLHPLAEEGFDLVGQMMGYIQADWHRREHLIKPALDQLADEWERQVGTAGRKTIERKMIILTQGLMEHPPGWDYTCLCLECCSNA